MTDVPPSQLLITESLCYARHACVVACVHGCIQFIAYLSCRMQFPSDAKARQQKAMKDAYGIFLQADADLLSFRRALRSVLQGI